MQPGSVIEFDVRTPVADAGLRSNVAHALSLGLPEVAPEAAGFVRIVANGPSARQAPLSGPTAAVNGSLALFGEKGPTYWIGCDPQAHLADFLKTPPEDTTYLVASKCDPSVFEALKGRRVLVWHIDDHSTWELVGDRDPVMCAVSVTICAFELLERIGFDRFETWGCDGCFMGGAGHAVPQAETSPFKTVVVGRRSFNSTNSWALEAEDAVNKFRWRCPNVTVKGGGMIGAILDYLVPQMSEAA